MMPKWFSIFVNERCVFDRQTTYTAAMDEALNIAKRYVGERVRMFVGKEPGKLHWDSQEWRGVTC